MEDIRFNLQVLPAAYRDLERQKGNRSPEVCEQIDRAAKEIFEKLRINAHLQGVALTNRPWRWLLHGALTVIFEVKPLDDRTVVILGFSWGEYRLQPQND
jgi:hypothetical protein